MNKFITVLTILFIALNYKFTYGESNIFEYIDLKEQVIKLKKEDESFSEKIYILKAELKNLKTGLSLIEEKAREELGLIKDKETFYQIIN